jgi:tetratricopeptide (TPR) repeat protein
MKIIILVSLLFFSCLISAQDINSYITQAGQYESAMNDEQAVVKYKDALKIQPNNIFAICKASELCSRIGARFKDDKAKQADYFAAARTYAQTALKLEPLNSESNFVMALVTGREAIIKGGKEKIMAVKEVKNYADLSIKYNPNNFKAWYILGKWYYEVSGLNYFERTAVRVFFGALPKAEIDDAIACFEKSKSINPGFVLNYLSLAKAYKKKDKEPKAKQNLASMISLPEQTQDDAKIKSEGRELLKKWN